MSASRSSWLAEVAADGGCFAAGILDALDDAVDAAGEHVVALIEGAGGDDDFRALHCVADGDGLADAAGGAGDDGDLAGEEAVLVDCGHGVLLQCAGGEVAVWKPARGGRRANEQRRLVQVPVDAGYVGACWRGWRGGVNAGSGGFALRGGV